MANPTYLVGVNPSAVPGGPLQQILVLTSDISGGGSTVSVNGSPVTNPDFGQSPSPPVGMSSVTWIVTGSDVNAYFSTTGSAVSFNDITSGINASPNAATMTVGS